MINLEVIETILMAPRACPIDLEPLRKMVELRRRRNISRRMTSRSLASTSKLWVQLRKAMGKVNSTEGQRRNTSQRKGTGYITKAGTQLRWPFSMSIEPLRGPDDGHPLEGG